MRSPRRRKKRPPERRQPPPERNDLDAAARAQLGRDEQARPYRPREDDASVEDPLGDWPEDAP